MTDPFFATPDLDFISHEDYLQMYDLYDIQSL